VSQLRLSATNQADFYLNVLSFDAPILGEMNSAQTRTIAQYYPIKSMQNDFAANVIFANETTWQQWQQWVHQLQINSQQINLTGGMPGCTLNWPERGINQWSAIIPKIQAGGMRANYTPRQTIQFQLIVNLVSNLGIFQSFGTAWQTLYANNFINGSILDSLLNLPASAGGALTPGNAAALAANSPVSSATTVGSTPAGLTSIVPGVGNPATGGAL
jgi:hypothetical protein